MSDPSQPPQDRLEAPQSYQEQPAYVPAPPPPRRRGGEPQRPHGTPPPPPRRAPPQYGQGPQPSFPPPGQPPYGPPPGGYPQYGGQQQPEPRKGAGLATSALVLGIIALVLCWVPIVNNFAAILAVVGLALSIPALISAR